MTTPANESHSRPGQASAWFLAIFAFVWGVVFFRLGQLRHERFATFGFDLGIYDQASWLVAHFRDPFMTVRGLDVFGHHATFALYLWAPGYWLGWGPIWLLFIQVSSQACGAGAVFLLARDVIESPYARRIGAVLGVLYLMHPTSGWLVWEFFHPDTFAIAPLLFAYWAARRQRWRIFWPMAMVAVACKEDFAFALAMLGVVVALRGRSRAALRSGAVISATFVAWYVVVSRVLIPWRNGGSGTFYEEEFFGDLGSSPLRVIWHLIAHPVDTWHRLTDPDSGHASNTDKRGFYWNMLAPFALVVPLLDPLGLLVGVPMVLINVLSQQPWTHNYQFHYAAIPLAAVTIATVEAMGRIQRRAKARCGDAFATRLIAILLAVLVSTSAIEWVRAGAGPGSRAYRSGIWPLRSEEGVVDLIAGVDFDKDPVAAAKRDALRLLPSTASVAAVYSAVAHVSDRAQAYEWPNPWFASNWGIKDREQRDPVSIQWIMLDFTVFSGVAPPNLAQRQMAEHLLSQEFTARFDQTVDGHRIVLAERTHAPVCVESPSPALLDHVGSHLQPAPNGALCPVGSKLRD